MLPIKLKPEQSDFIKEFGNKINTQNFPNRDNWYYIPFWFHEVEQNVFEIVSFDQIPIYLKNKILEERNKSPK